MLNAINNLWSIQAPRHAEGSDTHQYIQRHDPDQRRRRKKKQSGEEGEITDNEVTALSVNALQVFLKQVLNDAAPNGPLTKGRTSLQRSEKIVEFQREEQTPTLKSASAARAASLYQSASNVRKRTEERLLKTTDTASQTPQFDLSASDINTIQEILKELSILASHDINTLYISRSSSFIQSLKNAIKLQKQT